MKKNLAFLLAVLMLVPTLASCSEQTSGEEAGTSSTPTAGAEETVPEETEAPDPFADVDFDGREFRFYTSVDETDATNADKFIRGLGETNGEIVNAQPVCIRTSRHHAEVHGSKLFLQQRGSIHQEPRYGGRGRI